MHSCRKRQAKFTTPTVSKRMNAHSKSLANLDGIRLGELVGSLGFMLRMAQITSYQQFFEHNSKADPLPGEFSVLWVVGLNPAIRQGDVARALNIKRAHMTKLVKRLCAAGLLDREASKQDRRSVLLILTAKGQSKIEASKNEYLHFYNEGVPNLTSQESETLQHLLRKFVGIQKDKI